MQFLLQRSWLAVFSSLITTYFAGWIPLTGEIFWRAKELRSGTRTTLLMEVSNVSLHHSLQLIFPLSLKCNISLSHESEINTFNIIWSLDHRPCIQFLRNLEISIKKLKIHSFIISVWVYIVTLSESVVFFGLFFFLLFLIAVLLVIMSARNVSTTSTRYQFLRILESLAVSVWLVIKYWSQINTLLNDGVKRGLRVQEQMPKQKLHSLLYCIFDEVTIDCAAGIPP